MNQPERYSKNNSFQAGETTHLINRYLNRTIWNQGDSILEIGCGDGKYTAENFLSQLPDNIQRYVASDISDNMVEFARLKYTKKQYPKVEFITLDCQTESIPANLMAQFDYVVSFNCFHWFNNARRAVENIFKMLKPGGKVVATFFDVNPLSEIFLNLSKHPEWKVYGHEGYISNFFCGNYPEGSWEKVFLEAGFVNIRKFGEHRTAAFHDGFEDFFKALNPIYMKIPDDRKEAYLSDYLEEVKRGKAFSRSQDEKTGKSGVKANYKIMFFRASKPLTQ